MQSYNERIAMFHLDNIMEWLSKVKAAVTVADRPSLRNYEAAFREMPCLFKGFSIQME